MVVAKEPEVRHGEGFGAYRVRWDHHRDRRGGARQHVRLIEVQARHGLSLSDQCPRPGLVADRPSGSAVPQRWRVEDAFAIVKRFVGGLFPLQRRKHHPNALGPPGCCAMLIDDRAVAEALA